MPYPTDWNLAPLHHAWNIRFGMTFDEVVECLGEPDQKLSPVWGSRAQRAAWASGGIAIHFSPKVEFIEFSRQSSLRPLLEGLAPLELHASEVVERMAAAGHECNQDHPEAGYTYIYQDIQVAFWRHILPEGDDDEDGRYFDTVALGRPGYYS